METKPKMQQPLVAVSTDVRQFDNYTWHAAPQQYLEAAITGAGVFPLLVPSFGDRLDLDELLSSVDGVMLTGSKSNVHPSLYDGDPSEANGPYDPARDATGGANGAWVPQGDVWAAITPDGMHEPPRWRVTLRGGGVLPMVGDHILWGARTLVVRTLGYDPAAPERFTVETEEEL